MREGRVERGEPPCDSTQGIVGLQRRRARSDAGPYHVSQPHRACAPSGSSHESRHFPQIPTGHFALTTRTTENSLRALSCAFWCRGAERRCLTLREAHWHLNGESDSGYFDACAYLAMTCHQCCRKLGRLSIPRIVRVLRVASVLPPRLPKKNKPADLRGRSRALRVKDSEDEVSSHSGRRR